MGLGMLVVVPQAYVEQALALLPGDAYLVGEVVDGPGEITISD